MEDDRGPSREMGVALLVIGVAAALFCGFAEMIGVGGGTFGWKQIVGVVVGVLVALAGLAIVLRARTATQ
jgi:uncharacterized membrane protein (DUF441 family)